MLLSTLPPVVVLLMSNNFANAAIFNGILQIVVFILTANIPALVTGRMSYVDIAWPWGLVSIGLLPLIGIPANDFRAYFVMTAYLVAGARMALGGAIMFFAGGLQQEFPRYLYLREIIWAKKGITDESSFDFCRKRLHKCDSSD